MSDTAENTANLWLGQVQDEATRTEILQMLKDPAALEDAFYKNLEFGTGGMRGIMGVGSNRINRYTLGAATQGLANYLLKIQAASTPRVAIAYDCRNNSQSLALLVAEVLSANNIEALLCENLRPTPVLSFAVRHLDCQAGIVITASHNPPEYNGYKVYWSDGAQIVAPHDQRIIDEVRAMNDLRSIRFDANRALITVVGTALDEAFLSASLAQRKISKPAAPVDIVFTPLHGTSITLMPELFARAGYDRFQIVEDQATPDGNFPTVKSPNPEEPEALSMAIAQAEKTGAAVVLATDPDSDRIGVAMRGEDGQMMLINGNQCGALLIDYLLRKELEKKTLTGKEFVAFTIVSSDLFREVAKSYGCHFEVCLTGFKYIASLIREREGTMRFLGGGEESYGFMIGDFVRDKDALTSALIFCDMISEAVAIGQRPFDLLTSLYQKHGFYAEHLISITKKGKSGADEIAAMMETYRNTPPLTLAGERVTRLDDIQSGLSTDLLTGSTAAISLPSSNVLQFYTQDGSKVSARPSGTEPKIKFYFSVKTPWITGQSYRKHEEIAMVKVRKMAEELGLGGVL